MVRWYSLRIHMHHWAHFGLTCVPAYSEIDFSWCSNPDPPYIYVCPLPHISICSTSATPSAPLLPLTHPGSTMLLLTPTHPSIHPSIHPCLQTQNLSLGADPLEALFESRPHPVKRTQFCLVCHTKQSWRQCQTAKPPQTPSRHQNMVQPSVHKAC